jgi:ribose transport system permease protein
MTSPPAGSIDFGKAAGPSRRPTQVARRGGRLIVDSRPVLLIVLIGALSVFMLLTSGPRFVSLDNVSSVLLDTTEAGILTVGMMLLLVGGQVDLSIGSVLALTGIVSALLANGGWPIPLAWVGGIAFGGLCGAANGFIITRIHINALIVTLATGDIFGGVAQLFSGTGVTTIVPGYESIGQGVFLGLQYPVWVFFGLVGLFTFLTRRARFFRQYFFIGGSERAARLSGINTVRVTFLGFVIMGLLAGLAGVLTASRLDAAVISAGSNIVLPVITSAVLGGAALAGGSGSIPGAFLAVILISLIQNAMIISQVDVFWQQIVVGFVLIISVSTEYISNRAT